MSYRKSTANWQWRYFAAPGIPDVLADLNGFLENEITMPDGTKDYAPWALFVILLIVAILSFGTIFLFKKRMLQIRLTIFSSVVLIGYYMALIAYIFMLAEDTSFTPSWIICLPFIGIILNWLAIRGIGADEALVKAYDRLR